LITSILLSCCVGSEGVGDRHSLIAEKLGNAKYLVATCSSMKLAVANECDR
jgi:hypothetical protein